MDDYTVIWRPAGGKLFISSEVELTELDDDDVEFPFDMEEVKLALYRDYCRGFPPGDEVPYKSEVFREGSWDLVGIVRGHNLEWVW